MELRSTRALFFSFFPLLVLLHFAQLGYGLQESELSSKASFVHAKTLEGPTIDCYNYADQPTLRNPAFREYRNKVSMSQGTLRFGHSISHWGSCPSGSVPVIRRSGTLSKASERNSISSYKGPSLLQMANNSSTNSTADTFIYAGYYDVESAFGVGAELEVYRPYVEARDEYSGAFISLQHYDYAKNLSTDVIFAGWAVYPSLYNRDTRPRLTLFWSNSIKNNFCFNVECDGFVQVSNSVFPGVELIPSNTTSGARSWIGIEISKNESLRAWQLKCNGELVGYWPLFLFERLDTQAANYYYFSGSVKNMNPQNRFTKTDMGSSYFPGNADDLIAASIRFMKHQVSLSGEFVDTSPRLVIPRYEKCYDVSTPTVSARGGFSFEYGGKGYSPICAGNFSRLDTTLPSPSPPPPLSPPPPSRSSARARPNYGSSDLFLANVNLTSQPNAGKYFRYSSFAFIGNKTQPDWDIPSYMDWRDSVYPSILMVPSTCYPSWAIATVTATEMLYSIARNEDVKISTQQILDCSRGLGFDSCDGGWPGSALEYLSTTKVLSENAYPSTFTPGRRCVINGEVGNYSIAMYEEVQYGVFGLLLAVQNQPVIVNVQSRGNGNVFIDYKGGIFSDESCFTGVVDHSVVLVGYSYGGDSPYWIIRNSMGSDWGEDGHMLLSISAAPGVCGILATPAYYPVLSPSYGASSDSYEQSSGFKPCSILGVCGGGECIDNTTNSNDCDCPDTFVAAKTNDNSTVCTTKYVCQLKGVNPCGFGTCVNDMKGGYYCICSNGLFGRVFSENLEPTCGAQEKDEATKAVYGTNSSFYLTQVGDTCDKIYKKFGVNAAEIQEYNPSENIDCSSNFSIGLNLTLKTRAKCAVEYTWNFGDSCEYITNLVNISVNALEALNPGLNCSFYPEDEYEGRQICVEGGQPNLPLCGDYVMVSDGDDCSTIINDYKLKPLEFLLFNPGINCQSFLKPPLYNPSSGKEVCVDTRRSDDAIKSTMAAKVTCKKNSKLRRVRRGQGCDQLVAKYFRKSFQRFKQFNAGFICRNVKEGQGYCVP